MHCITQFATIGTIVQASLHASFGTTHLSHIRGSRNRNVDLSLKKKRHYVSSKHLQLHTERQSVTFQNNSILNLKE